MKRELIFEKRKKARSLHAKGWSCRKIARYLVAGVDSVRKWVKLNESELQTDQRGWEKGKLRKHEQTEATRIVKIRKDLEAENSYFIGAKVVQKNYINQFNETVPLWFVNRVLQENNLVKSPTKKPKKRSRYMQYPEETLRKFGKTVMSADFIGPKYLKGSDKRINFLSCKYLRPMQHGIVKRVEGQTTSEALRVLKEVWQHYPLPDAIKLDNDSAFGANLSHKESIGQLPIALLNLGVTPVYVAPRSPWNNGDVEGFNSIFSKKFWSKLKFNNEEELSVEIKKFNVEYEKYTNLVANNSTLESPRYLDDVESSKLNNRSVEGFGAQRIIFLRIVRRKGEKEGENERGFIEILGREVELPKAYINLFTFCELQVKEKRLRVKVEEPDGKLTQIKSVGYKLKNVKYEG